MSLSSRELTCIVIALLVRPDHHLRNYEMRRSEVFPTVCDYAGRFREASSICIPQNAVQVVLHASLVPPGTFIKLRARSSTVHVVVSVFRAEFHPK